MKDNCVYYGWGMMNSVVNLPEDDFALTVGYVTKYMTKEDDFVTKYLGKMRVRRIQTSRKIGAVPKSKSDYEWEVVTGVSKYQVEDIQTIDLNRSREIKISDFEGESWYPTMKEVIKMNRLVSGSD
jgi:hypothetical protein